MARAEHDAFANQKQSEIDELNAAIGNAAKSHADAMKAADKRTVEAEMALQANLVEFNKRLSATVEQANKTIGERVVQIQNLTDENSRIKRQHALQQQANGHLLAALQALQSGDPEKFGDAVKASRVKQLEAMADSVATELATLTKS